MSNPNPLAKMHYYHLRLDCSLTAAIEAALGKWIFINHVHKYHCIHEISDLGKPHLHCFLVFGEKLNAHEIRRMRSYWSGKLDSTYQPLSFVQIKCPSSMWKYINKKPNTLTGIQQSDISNITNSDCLLFISLKNKIGEKRDKQQQLMHNLQSIVTESTPFKIFCDIYMTEYHKIYQKYPRFRIQFYSVSLTLGIISNEQYFKAINLDIYLEYDKPNSYASLVSTVEAYKIENKELQTNNNQLMFEQNNYKL